MSEHAHVEVYKGFRIVIDQDTDTVNPREDYDHAALMICFHSRYKLGDKHNYSDPDDLFETLCGRLPDRKDRNPVSELLGDGSEFRIVWEPLYLYDHSGITMSTSPFSCGWDSGQVGIIYITYEKLAHELGVEYSATWVPTPEQIATAEENLKGEVKEFDQYIRGDVYHYAVYAPDDDANGDDEDPTFDEDDKEFWMDDSEDACGGMFGLDYTITTAKEAIDAIVSVG